MELGTCRFYYGGDAIHFSIFSNAVCRACYLESIRVHFEEVRIDVYVIEPSSRSRWVVIIENKGEYTRSMWFMRGGDTFVECASHEIPNQVTAEILHKFPHLAHQINTKAA